MNLTGYNIILESLTAVSAEKLRQWRNKPAILAQMEYQHEISETEQQQWFKNLEIDANKYFIIKVNNCEIGMIHVHHINHETKSGETGLFIGETNYSGTGVALGASLLLLDYCFDALDLKNVSAKVRNTNAVAQQYNQLLGFEKTKELDDFFSEYTLNLETFKANKNRLVKLIA